jgi:glycosyltransferase involved in cell wall biosynthesis
MSEMHYLLVTPIPFALDNDGAVIIDRLWAEDLRGLVTGVGPVTVAAPRLSSPREVRAWGPGTASLSATDDVTFIPLPVRRSRLDLTFPARVRSVLRKAVVNADIVHSSNFFIPYTPLYYAHDLASRLGKRTLFVVAEDFVDMLNWEWVRTAPNAIQRYRRRYSLRRMDCMIRKRVSSASLTFLHTPAAVARYREFAANAVAIRQPVHEREDVIPSAEFESKCERIRNGSALTLVAACRMEPLKGVDFIVRAVGLLKERGIFVRARLYGSGKDLERLKLLAQMVGVTDAVSFPGTLAPGLELQDALRRGDIFVMPHLTSDFGRAFFDAIAAGMPVVAFRSVASQDTVRHDVDGIITPNADFEGLADGVTRYHTDRDHLVRCSVSARDRALVNTKTHWHQIRSQLIRNLFDIVPEANSGFPPRVSDRL